MSDYYRNNRGGYGGNGGRGGKRHGGGGRGGPWNSNNKRARQNFNGGGGPYHRGTNNNDYYRHQPPPPQGGYHYGIPARPGSPPPVPHGPFGSADIRIEQQRRNDDPHDEPGQVVPEPAPSMKQDESAPTNNGRDAKKPPLSEDEVFQEKLKEQIPASEPNLFSSLPPQAKKAPSESFWQHRRKCAEQVEGIIEKEVTSSSAAARKADSSDDSDEEEEDCYIPHETIGALDDDDAAKNPLKRFVRALPDNLLFAIGFDLTGDGSDGGTCYCPCGKKNKPWQEQYRLVVADNKACDRAFDTPRALVAHLDALQNIHTYQDHKYALKYLELVYARSCIPYLKHHAFYDPQSKESKMIKKKEIEDMTRQTAEAQANLEKVRATHLKLSEKHEKLKKEKEEKDKEVKRIGEKLGVNGKPPPIPSAEEMDGFSLCYNSDLKRHRMIYRFPKKVPQDALFKVSQDFKLSTVLDQWYGRNHVIFRPMDFETAQRLVNPSTVEYELSGVIKGLRMKKSEKEELFKGRDEGGLTKDFFSEFFNQLPCLQMPFGDRVRLPLFEEGKAGCAPSLDFNLRDTFVKAGGSSNNWPEAEARLSAMYEGIGRMMAHAVYAGLTIPTFVLSPLFRSVCIRGLEPRDANYKVAELFYHSMQENVKKDYLKTLAPEDVSETPSGEASELALTIQENFIDSRKIALEGLRKGFILNGYVGFHQTLYLMPLEAVNRLMFANPYFTADDVIELLVEANEPTGQQIDFRKNLVAIIAEEAEKDKKDFLPDLLQYITGQNYLPFDEELKKKMKITIYYDGSESSDPMMLPEVHTCVPSITFPATLYDGDKETLRGKIITGKEYSLAEARFSMN